MSGTKIGIVLGCCAGLLAAAGRAGADDRSLSDRLAAVESALAVEQTPSQREIHRAVDAYLAADRADAALVGGPGSAGYDGGFWIRGGTFLLRTNLTLQARYEYFAWSERANEPSPGGDLSGFSLPRATVKFSGDATCNVHYYTELQFGFAAPVATGMMEPGMEMGMGMPGMVEFMHDPGVFREGWIEYEASRAFSVRLGLVQLPSTRQLMTPPEMQQFVDVSLAAASVGQMMPGYTDRPRDYGLLFHGALDCQESLTYMVSVTNGDGPWHHNVVDGTTNDNLAYGARVNWDFAGHMGYEECALRQTTCQWVGAVGVWGFGWADVVMDNPHENMGDMYDVGIDLALGYGGFSFCAAYTYGETTGGDPGTTDSTSSCWCVQAGYLFPGTAWELAARYSVVTMDMDMGLGGSMTEGAHEFGFAVNYFVDGHADKLTVDASFISGDDAGNVFNDAYTGYQATGTNDGMLVRFQWQLAL